MRYPQFHAGHTPYLPKDGSRTICKDCHCWVEAQLGHPNGIRCTECHLKYLETIREAKAKP